MESSLLNGWGIDPAYIIIALAVLTLVLLVAVLVCIGQYRKLYRRYDIFMARMRKRWRIRSRV